MIIIKPLLIEASYADIAQVLNSCLLKDWSNIKLIESLSHSFSFHDEKTTKEILLKSLTEFWDSKCNKSKNSVKAVAKAIDLAAKMLDVINSRPVHMIINNNIAEQRRHIQKQQRASVRDDILDQGYKDAETSLANNTNTVDRTEVPEEHEPPKQKKRKSLNKKEFKTLGRAEQLKKLTEFYGTGGVLDLTRKAFIPKRFASEIGALKKIYMLLCYLYKDNLLENHDHNEDWFRIMVYGDLFDYIFASAEGYTTKRSECHSRIIKSLKELRLIKEDEPNVRLDFIFCNTSVTGINDVLICEDKPTENESTKDIKKTRKLREKSLVYWRSILHCSNALEHLSSTSCRFNKLNLLITATKIIDSTIVHTTLKEVSIPVSERSGGAIADFISVVISLMRTIMKNIDTIEAILQVIHQDNLSFLTPKNDSFIYESDSDSSTDSTISTSSSGKSWQAAEREERIKERVDEAISMLNEQYQSQYVSTDWESNAFTDNN